MIREIKETDFESYKKLRKTWLEDFQEKYHKDLNISSENIKKEFEELLSNPKRTAIILEEDNKIIGYIIGSLYINVYRKATFIDDLFIDKKYRKKGFATKLLNEFFKWSASKEAKSIGLGVHLENHKALKLYKKLGFSITNYEMNKEL